MPNQPSSPGNRAPRGAGSQRPPGQSRGGGATPQLPTRGLRPGLRVGAPNYIARFQDALKECPPGHTFRLYFAGWDDSTWSLTKTQRKDVLDGVAGLSSQVRSQIKSIIARQERALKKRDILHVCCVTASPFTTGLGYEHPLENGFAFLDPYGIPYLPGSGVKGSVRRAAEELALFESDSHGWAIPTVWWLFGFDENSAYFAKRKEREAGTIGEERQRWQEAYRTRLTSLSDQDALLFKEFCAMLTALKLPREKIERALTQNSERSVIRQLHVKGALHFFDVVPYCADGLKVDIMNPHYGHYYQKNQVPGDWGDPVPIFFLTLPAGTTFNFFVGFQPPTTWPQAIRSHFLEKVDGEPRWKRLVVEALTFAWEWQGFGAKTSIGYGRFLLADGKKEAQPGPFANGDRYNQEQQGVVNSKLAPVAARLARGGPFSRQDVESVANEICKNYRAEEAAALAKQLWELVKDSEFFARLLKANPIFKDLLRKGGISV